MRKLFCVFILLLSFPLSVTLLHATPTNNDPVLEAQIRNLELLLKSIQNLSETIAIDQKKLRSSEGLGREEELRSQINELSLKLKKIENTFIHIIQNYYQFNQKKAMFQQMHP